MTKKRYEHTPAERRIRAAMARMPYGGLTAIDKKARRVGFRDGEMVPITMAAIADYLDALRGVLAEETDDRVKEKNDLDDAIADLDTIKRVFGLSLRRLAGDEIRLSVAKLGEKIVIGRGPLVDSGRTR